VLKPTPPVDEPAPARSLPVGVAVIGLGYWGPNLLRVLADNSDVEVLWICDLDPERLAKYRGRYPASRATTQLDRVLADSRVDAAFIAIFMANAVLPMLGLAPIKIKSPGLIPTSTLSRLANPVDNPFALSLSVMIF